MNVSEKDRTQMKQKQRGLTLIETMMVLAAIGILATILIPPAYQVYEDYRAGERAAGAAGLLETAKSRVAGFYLEKGRWPTKGEFDRLVPARSGNHVSSLTPAIVGEGFQITVTFKKAGVGTGPVEEGNGRTLIVGTRDGVKWACDDSTGSGPGVPGLVSGSVLVKHHPEACQ
jgi:type IV pilus assembly protein PilA